MPDFRMFELREELTPYRSARAVLLKFNGFEYVPTREEVRVHEFVGCHGDKGDRGYAFLSQQSELWEVACGLFQQVAGWSRGA